MAKKLSLFKVSSIAILLSVAMPVFSEPAPVYDVDSMPYENGMEQAQDMPPPPPGQEVFLPREHDETQAQVQASAPVGGVDQRIRKMEQQMDNLQSNDLMARLDSLQEQVQTLRGQVEQLTHELQKVESQQKNSYSDSGKGVKDKPMASNDQPLPEEEKPPTETTTANTPVATNNETANGEPGLSPNKISRKAAAAMKANKKETKSTADQPNVAEEQQIYQTAYNYIKEKKYSDAVTALQGMLKKYPSGQFAANAHYWLGELYGLMNKHDEALTEFSTVVRTFPDSPRISDAQLKVGLIYASQSKWPNAKTAFKAVINHYPGTASARLASEQLKQIKQAGH